MLKLGLLEYYMSRSMQNIKVKNNCFVPIMLTLTHEIWEGLSQMF